MPKADRKQPTSTTATPYDAEKRAALDTWARTLSEILEPKEAGTVVSFEQRA